MQKQFLKFLAGRASDRLAGLVVLAQVLHRENTNISQRTGPTEVTAASESKQAARMVGRVSLQLRCRKTCAQAREVCTENVSQAWHAGWQVSSHVTQVGTSTDESLQVLGLGVLAHVVLRRSEKRMASAVSTTVFTLFFL